MKENKMNVSEKEFYEMGFCETKEELVEAIEDYIERYEESENEDDVMDNAKVIYEVVKELARLVKKATMPEKLDNYWYYTAAIDENKAYVALAHADECDLNSQGEIKYLSSDAMYEIISTPVPDVSSAEFAELVGVKEVTIRQWIRRGKLTSGYKMGNQWRIPVVAVINDYGVAGQSEYEWKTYLGNLPEEFEYLNDYSSVVIWQNSNRTGKYSVEFYGNEAKCIEMDVKEKEKLEVFLVAHPNIVSKGCMIDSITLY